MQVIKSIGVLSCAKISGALYAALGLLFMPILLIIGLAGAATSSGSDRISAIAMVPLALLAPVFYGVLGFLGGALSAWLYNLMAKWVGGIQLKLEPALPAAGASPRPIGVI